MGEESATRSLRDQSSAYSSNYGQPKDDDVLFEVTLPRFLQRPAAKIDRLAERIASFLNNTGVPSAVDKALDKTVHVVNRGMGAEDQGSKSAAQSPVESRLDDML